MINRWKHRTNRTCLSCISLFISKAPTASILSPLHLICNLSPEPLVVAISSNSPFFQNTLSWIMSSHVLPLRGSLSLIDNGVYVVEKKTGTSFPSALSTNLKLCGIGLHKTTVFGFKNIVVYAFGVYADDLDIEKYLGEKYEEFDESELKGNKEFVKDLMETDIPMKGNKEFVKDLMETDIPMAVRFEIVCGSVRNAFEESVGSRLLKFGGSDNKELLQRFTSQFKDEFKIPRGSITHLSRDKGHVLRTIIDGQEVGSIESKFLCKAILDLYFGEESFDKVAKEEIELNVATYL